MKVSKEDVFKPANGVSLLGLGLCLWGAKHIDSYTGIAVFALGRSFDLIDGPIARRTGSSQFGAGIDAGSDKIALAAATYYLFKKTNVSRVKLGGVVVHNTLTAGATAIAAKNGVEVSPALAGKHAMALEGSGLMGAALEQAAIRHGHARVEKLGRFISHLTGVGVAVGLGSSLGIAEAGQMFEAPGIPEYFRPVLQSVAEPSNIVQLPLRTSQPAETIAA